MNFRHEVKFEINYCDMMVLRQRLNAVLYRDGNAPDGKYFIRSLYFDTDSDRALREKADGINRREKFRMRIYNMDSSLVKLEKKSKIDLLTSKQSVCITREQAEKILAGDTDWMTGAGEALIYELHQKMTVHGLKPRVIVDYTREAYCHPAGNVRVTLDSNIRTGLSQTDFLNESVITVPACDGRIVLEVKWDEFLPQFVKDAVSVPSRHAGAFSKYAACRMFG